MSHRTEYHVGTIWVMVGSLWDTMGECRQSIRLLEIVVGQLGTTGMSLGLIPISMRVTRGEVVSQQSLAVS